MPRSDILKPRMNQKPDPPDWNNFEVYRGGEPASQRPAWLDRLLHFSLLFLFLVVVFGVGGSLGFLLMSRNSRLSASPEDEKSLAWAKFITGGVAADAIVLGWIYGNSRRQP